VLQPATASDVGNVSGKRDIGTKDKIEKFAVLCERVLCFDQTYLALI